MKLWKVLRWLLLGSMYVLSVIAGAVISLVILGSENCGDRALFCLNELSRSENFFWFYLAQTLVVAACASFLLKEDLTAPSLGKKLLVVPFIGACVGLAQGAVTLLLFLFVLLPVLFLAAGAVEMAGLVWQYKILTVVIIVAAIVWYLFRRTAEMGGNA